MNKPIRWGILGTGGIARQFAASLKTSDTGSLVAVGSRSEEKARQFADEFNAPLASDYEQLLKSDVDAVYISLPNAMHHPWSIHAMAAGKHVLCEKPIAANEAQAREMFAAAEEHERILIEAFMYRHHPAMIKVLELARSGVVGRIKMIRANFTFNRPASASDVRYHAELAGGSLMDVGCYCTNVIRAIAGAEPTEEYVITHPHELGVDDYAVALLGFDGGLLATMTCGMTIESCRQLTIAGEQGYITMNDPWFCDGSYAIVKDGVREEFVESPDVDKYTLEADEMARLIREGGAPLVTAADSIGNMHLLDCLRSQYHDHA